MRYLRLTELVFEQPDVSVGVVAGGLLLGALALGLAYLLGWGKVPAVLAGFSLALALSVTLVRPNLGADVPLGNPLAVCVPGTFSLSGDQAVLNFLMLMPLGFFGVLATRRPLLVALGCASVSAGIELTQAILDLGVCDGQDFVNNSVGAAVATLAGWLLLLAVRAVRVGTVTPVR